MGITYSGAFYSSIPEHHPSDPYPQRGKVSLSATFDEVDKEWDVSWYATADGGYGGTKYTDFYNGFVYFYTDDATNPINQKVFAETIHATVDTILLSGSFSVAPDQNGSLTLNAASYFLIYWSVSPGGDSWGSATFNFPTVQLGSKLIVTENTYTVNSTNIDDYLTFKIASEGPYYHDVKIGDSNSTINVLNKTYINNETITYSNHIQFRSLLSIARTASATLYLYLDTYKRDGHNPYEKIGSVSVGITINVDTATVKPSINVTNQNWILSTPFPGTFIGGTAVAGWTIPSALLSVSNANICPISEITFQIKVSDEVAASKTFVYEPNPSTSSFRVNPASTFPAGTTNYTATVSIIAKDSRGATNSLNRSISVYAYAVPRIDAKIYRVDNNTSTEESESGEFLYFGVTASQPYTCNGNNINLNTTVKDSQDTRITPIYNKWIPFTKDQSETYRIDCNDAVATATTYVTIHRAVWPLQLFDDLNGDIGSEHNGWVRQVNDEFTKTTYKQQSGNLEMESGIFFDNSDPNNPIPYYGTTVNGQLTNYFDGTNYHIPNLSLLGTNYRDTITVTAADYPLYRNCLVSGSGIVIATVSNWKQVDSNAGEMIAMIDHVPNGGSAFEIARSHFLSQATNNHCVSASAGCFVQDGDAIRLGVWCTAVGDKVIITNVVSIGCTLTLDNSYHTIS